MDYNHAVIRTLTDTIFDIRGASLPKGFSFAVSKLISTAIVNQQDETCLICLDNGKNHLEDWEQHVVNKSKMYDNSSRYVGVSFDKKTGQWKSQIFASGELLYLGIFRTEEEAYAEIVKYEKNKNNTV
jgi:tRNA U54 and U55 pseudouridine synthase Pus10